MKNLIFKSLMLAGALTLAWNCSDENPSGPKQPEYLVTSEAWLLQTDADYIIYPDGRVTNAQGDLIGTISFLEGTSIGVISDLQGTPISGNVDVATLAKLEKNTTIYTIAGPVWHLIDNTGDYLIYPAAEGATSCVVTDPDGNYIANLDLATMNIISLDGVTVLTTGGDIGALPVLNPGDKFTKQPDPVIVSSSSEAPIIESSSALPPSSSSVASSSSVQSSSSAKSSSSSAKSSSSVQSSSSSKPAGGCPNIQKKNGAKGEGWATRYWDCCKPHCSWPEHAHGNYSKQCTNKGKTESTDWGGGSVCSGGGLMTCTSQVPFTVDGCDEMGFAFAAVPASNGGDCGKCFQLTFTGKGKYSTDANHRAIKDKKLIIMVTNIGGDVNQGQFDIMIPGGGFGAFNGCGQMGWNIPGNSEQYGGLLSDCEKETKYNASKTLTCLQEKCNSAFSNDSQAKEGCLFLAGFMHAAGNPLHNYEEVECPQVLKDKY